jgi:hypothetical protein
MLDLQRRIGLVSNTVCGWMQGDPRNSDASALADSHRSQIFSALDSGENFIRWDFSE